MDTATAPSSARPDSATQKSTPTSTQQSLHNSVPDYAPTTVAPLIHLVHRPATRDGLLLGAPAATEHTFVLSVELPQPPRTGAGLYELQPAIDAVRRACAFAARQYFGVPEGRVVLPTATEAVVTDLRPWRRGGRPAHATIDLRLRGADLVDGVPGTLRCESTVSIGGRPCGRGRSRLLLGPPAPHPTAARGYRGDRGERHRQPGSAVGGKGFRAAAPAAVGCGEPGEVVVSEPLSVSAGTVLVAVRPTAEQVAPGVGPSSLDAALRQTALLSVGLLRGFHPAGCAITRWSAAVTRFAEPDRPLVCAAAPGAVGRDAEGRPVAPVGLRVLQDGRTVATADVTVLLDC
ncbi:hypothetical protein ACFYNO_04730 [Kitasatospora sp. NPDC006697]|uniref:hypothetical protein n=1 Tax=Kitasatospora sp. NPDC006697 TaxID=3364020 RepID=UPI0036A417C3